MSSSVTVAIGCLLFDVVVFRSTGHGRAAVHIGDIAGV
jgi:hypothetical protein